MSCAAVGFTPELVAGLNATAARIGPQLAGALVAVAAIAVGALCVVRWSRAARRLERTARAVHDLRAPLTAARLALHSAGRERGWSGLARVDHELARAAIALDDVEAARLGRAPRVVREVVDARALLDEVLRSWTPLAWPLGRALRIEGPAFGFGGDGPLRVAGDRARLAQALGNLVGNALEHGSGTVVLRVRAGTRERIRFEVEDAGPGLPAPITALARRRRSGRGSRGRGLAIAREAARVHGGSVHDEPITGGCRLVLELPSAEGEPEPGAGEPGPAQPPAAAPVWAEADPVPALAALRTAGVARIRPRPDARGSVR